MFWSDVFLSKTAGLQLGQKPARVADKDMEQDLIKCLKVPSNIVSGPHLIFLMRIPIMSQQRYMTYTRSFYGLSASNALRMPFRKTWFPELDPVGPKKSDLGP